ncbi:hypothetical protein C7M84_002953 [Penaeus vannamei]|uniref:Rho-GAP domain-containing protein n=1 Tax=Penaeus vannamei TaxID=6689 RepID=A0A423TPI6_PENVA|nr:hypothetical protein C7M84_002953 [Penaeus vannamei]
MESFASVELEDYFNEVRTISRRTSQSNSQSEEEVRSHEGESLLQDSASAGSTLLIVANSGSGEEEALKRRVRTLNATIRRKKQRQKPDIRNFFANTDESPWCQQEVLAPSDSATRSPQWQDDRPLHMYRAPSLDMLPKVGTGHLSSGKELRRQRSYARDIARDVKSFHSKQGHRDPGAGVSVHRLRAHPPRALQGQEPPLESASTTRTVQDLESIPDSPRRMSAELRNTDLGFKVIYSKPDEEFPVSEARTSRGGVFRTLHGVGISRRDLVVETSRCGQTRMDWLDESDLGRLTSLALLELDILFTEHNIHHRWRKLKKRKQNKEESGVFGVRLDSLIERDRSFLEESPLETKVPLVFYKLALQLERQGLRQEGIMRVPGHRSQIEQLRRALDTHFYTSPGTADSALRNATPNDVAALIKTFLRELPQPLLTHTNQDMGERILALTMLILLLPSSHRDTLHAVLELCARVVAFEDENKMTLYNIAMIVAPNLFLPSNQRQTKP